MAVELSGRFWVGMCMTFPTSGKVFNSHAVTRHFAGLYKMGMHGRLCRKKPYLKPVHVRKWKAWLTSSRNGCLFNGALYGFPMNLCGSDGKIYCWRRVGEEFHPRNTIPTVKGSTGKVNVWGVISYHGIRQLHHVIGNMDSEQLEGILEDSLLCSFDDRRTNPTYPFYAMDNDPKHSSQWIQGWFRTNGIKLLDWPAYWRGACIAMTTCQRILINYGLHLRRSGIKSQLNISTGCMPQCLPSSLC